MKSFLNFELDEELYELRRDGEVVATHRRVFDFILYLMHHRDRVVSKEELTRELWEAQVTSDTAISQVVMLARKAVYDEGKTQRVIKTVRGRGFRFIAELRTPEAETSAAPRAVAPAPAGSTGANAALGRGPEELVGRESELQVLQHALDELRANRGGMISIEGEPGIGKTMLVDALALRATAQGIDVHWGRAWEEGAAPLWPWIQVLRSLYQRDGDAATRRFMGAGLGELTDLLPELGQSERPAAGQDLIHARFRLFDAMARYLKYACQRALGQSDARPRLIILDDLHAVDEASLQLLRFLAPELREMALLVVGTLRDLGLAHQPALAQLAVDDAQRIRLSGLDLAEVSSLLGRRLSQPPSELMTQTLHELSAGNPLLVCELSRRIDPAQPDFWIEPSVLSPAILPERIASAVRQHLSDLPKASLCALANAAALGREFRLPILAAVSGCAEADLLETLAPAIARGLVGSGTSGPDQLRFSHALVRSAIYAELSASSRIDLHRRIAEQLEQTESSQRSQLHEIAHHYLLAAASGCRHKAIEYARRAAQRASDMRAYEVAASLYDRALQLTESHAFDSQLVHELLCAAGEARYQAGQLEQATARFDRAARLALAERQWERFATAVLGAAHAVRGSLVHDRPRQLQVREALRLLPAEDSELRANLLAASAIGARGDMTLAQRDATTSAAIEMARRLGDDRILLRTLTVRHSELMGLAHPRELLAIADEMVALGRKIHDHELLLDALICRIQDRAELGDHIALYRDHAEYVGMAEQYGSPWHGYMLRVTETTMAAMVGEFVRAADVSEQALRQGQRLGDPLSEAFHAIRALFGHVACGVRSASEDAVPLLAEPPSFVPADYHPLWALPWAIQGRRADASQLIDRILSQERNQLFLPSLRRPLLAIAGHASALLGDPATAEAIYQLLLPSAGLYLHLQAGVYLGPVCFYLGTLAASFGQHELAATHFRQALDQCRHVRMWAARCELGMARALGTRSPSRARELLISAEARARQLGMRDLREDIQAELARYAGRNGAHAPARD